jgi:putative transposase
MPINKKTAHKQKTPGDTIALVTIQTIDNEMIFRDPQLASIIARMLTGQRLFLDAKWLSWVLMPDHWRGLLHLGEQPLIKAVARFKTTTTLALNQHLNVSGSFWQKSFAHRLLGADEDLLLIARDLILAPVRDGLVTRVGDYPYWDAVWL